MVRFNRHGKEGVNYEKVEINKLYLDITQMSIRLLLNLPQIVT